MTIAGVAFTELRAADLILDQTYLAGMAGHARDDPLAVLLPVGNQGGFRYVGSPAQGTVRLVVLYTSGVNPDWPDVLDAVAGSFTYYGDNRNPGRDLHDTQRRGNEILRVAFDRAQSGREGRATVPPFLLFERADTSGRAVRFRGLLAPGSPSAPPDQQLSAIWRSRNGMRFQNYRALFTVLDAPLVTRAWLDELLNPGPLITTGAQAPSVWRDWVIADDYGRCSLPRRRTTAIERLKNRKAALIESCCKFFGAISLTEQPISKRVRQSCSASKPPRLRA